MKYIKLFEAFSSEKLSKTLGYLSKSGKAGFIDMLRNVCDAFKIPLSEITDDCFLYLPYKRALVLNKESESKDINLIKFWFSATGEYVDATYSDSTKSEVLSSGKFSRLEKDYDVIRELDEDDLHNLPVGSTIKLSCTKGTGIGYLYRHTDNYYTTRNYILQDFARGSSPRDDGDRTDLSNIAISSWVIVNSDDYRSMFLLSPKAKEEEENNLSGNYLLFFKKLDRYGREINPFRDKTLYNGVKKVNGLYLQSKHVITKELIANANFSLVLDLDLVKSKSYRDLDKLKSDRLEAKKDAFISPDEVKSRNIDRYIKGILDLPVSGDISPVSIKRALGYDKILFVMTVIDYKKRLDKLIEKYDKVLNADGKAATTKAVADVKKYLKKLTGDSLLANKRYTKYSADLKDALRKEGKAKSLEILDGIEKLSSLIYQKLKINNIETIYDLEVLLGKVASIDAMLKSKRNGLSLIYGYYVKNSLNTNFDSRYRIISDDRYLPDIETFRKGLDRVTSIISSW